MSYFPPVPVDRHGNATPAVDPFVATPNANAPHPAVPFQLQTSHLHARQASHQHLNHASPTSTRLYNSDAYRRGRSNTMGWPSPQQDSMMTAMPPVSQMQGLQRSSRTLYDQRDNNAPYSAQLAHHPSQNAVLGLERQMNDLDAGFESPDRRQMHHRFDSYSSQHFPDDYSLSFSEPSSDFTSDMSENCNWPSIPAYLQPYASTKATNSAQLLRTEDKPAATDIGQTPDFLLDELKMLKLENMALRQLAHEVISVEHAKELSADAASGQATSNCPHHPPLQHSAILQHVRRTSGSHTSPSSAAVDFVLQNSPNFGVPANSQPVPMQADRLLQQSYNKAPPLTQTAGNSSSRAGSYDEATAGLAFPFQPLTHSQEHPNVFGAAPNDIRPLSTASTRQYRAYSEPLSMAMIPAQEDSSTSLRRLDNLSASILVSMILEKRGQEASMLLQSQAQSASQERKDEIYEAVRRQLMALCYDRHGNFLVQRLLETRPELSQGLAGAFVELTTSQFSCHVVQKVLEGGQDVRRKVTEELLRSQLDQTMTSRNSIHVWQQILETEWTDSNFRKHMFSTINEQLKGKWTFVATQETGSIICQNIFESAKDKAEKQECMQEVLANLEECAPNQWGIWVVQHVIEHGDDQERATAFDGLLKSAITLTLSSYGQKAIMSALKTASHGSASESASTGENESTRSFVDRFVHLICQPCGDQGGTRRPALIDISLSPHGIQIITQLLTTIKQDLRDKLIVTVRRNSVFLKGSKTGMKVHQLCERARAFAGY